MQTTTIFVPNLESRIFFHVAFVSSRLLNYYFSGRLLDLLEGYLMQRFVNWLKIFPWKTLSKKQCQNPYRFLKQFTERYFLVEEETFRAHFLTSNLALEMK